MKKNSGFLRKLKNSRGESIAEVLVSLLIAAVALVMLASMITSATSMIDKARKSANVYYEAENDLVNAELSSTGYILSKRYDSTQDQYVFSYSVLPRTNVKVKYEKKTVNSKDIYLYEADR